MTEHEFELELEQKYGDVELKTKTFSRLKYIGVIKDTETGKVMEKISLTIEVDMNRLSKYPDLFGMDQGKMIGLKIVEPAQTSLDEFK